MLGLMPGIVVNLLWAIAVICLVLALLAFLSVVAAPWTVLLIVGIVCAVVAFFLGRYPARRV